MFNHDFGVHMRMLSSQLKKSSLVQGCVIYRHQLRSPHTLKFCLVKFPQQVTKPFVSKFEKQLEMQILPWTFVLISKWQALYSSLSNEGNKTGTTGCLRSYIWWAGSTLERNKLRTLQFSKVLCCPKEERQELRGICMKEILHLFPSADTGTLWEIQCCHCKWQRMTMLITQRNQLFFHSGGKSLHKRIFSEPHPPHSILQIFSAKSFSV